MRGRASSALTVKQVVVVVRGGGYHTAIVRGIAAHRVASRFTLRMYSVGHVDEIPERYAGQKLDGILAPVEYRPQLKLLRRFSPCVVNFSNVEPVDCPRAGPDEHAIARMAVDHFASRGFQQLGFCGYPDTGFSLEREEGMRAATAAAGLGLSVFRSRVRFATEPDWEESLARWVRSLPRPVGIVAALDKFGTLLLDVLQRLGVRVPEEVAVLGVDNDDTLCHFSQPPLSSIDAATERVGYEAASLLDQMMAGDLPAGAARTVLVPPARVVTRQSSDVFAVADPDVAAALRFIGEHVGDGITVKDVLAAVPVARRGLERRFLKCLGRSPRDEIQRVRVERAKELLAKTDITMPAVARRCGFDYATHFAALFKRQTGYTPTAYRQHLRTMRP